MRKFVLFAVLALASTAAFAGGSNGNNGGGNQCQGNSCGGAGVVGVGGIASGYIGSIDGSFSAGTQGGSMAQTSIGQNGVSYQFTQNSGASWAGVSGNITNSGAYGSTFGGSTAESYSEGMFEGTAGNYYNTTAGGVGNSFEANIEGEWKAAELGGFIVVGGFAGFTGFGH